MSPAPRLALVSIIVALSLTVTAGNPAIAQTSPSGGAAAPLPVIPDPVAVSVDASTTAFLALDFNSTVCANIPACVDTLPAVGAAVTAARTAKALVAYSSTPNATLLPEVLAQPDDPVVTSSADKFFNTNLDDVLKQHGIMTVVIAGTVTNGAALYTSFGAAVRGYTVVVVEDGVSARSEFANYATLWQLLNGPGTSNPQNTPLQPKAATLSRTDLITYR